MLVIGIDLAWGETKSDGVCFIRRHRSDAWVEGYAYPKGDDALLATIAERLPQANSAFIAIDAPIVCPNPAGSRPVDIEISRMFWREHAGCHSANSTRCARPPRLLVKLAQRGFVAGTDGRVAPRLVAEVYPHPAMVRLCRLPRVVKYKKGPAAARRAEFCRLQTLLFALVVAEFPFLELDDTTHSLLEAPWSKPTEDQLDAFFCALIGLWHLHHGGRRSEIVGDLSTGFILLPVADRRDS